MTTPCYSGEVSAEVYSNFKGMNTLYLTNKEGKGTSLSISDNEMDLLAGILSEAK